MSSLAASDFVILERGEIWDDSELLRSTSGAFVVHGIKVMQPQRLSLDIFQNHGYSKI